MRTGIIQDSVPTFDYETVMTSEGSDDVLSLLRECVCESEGLSGRCLRKLPFQAYAMWLCGCPVSVKEYLNALKRSVIVGNWLLIHEVEREGRSFTYTLRLFVKTKKRNLQITSLNVLNDVDLLLLFWVSVYVYFFVDLQESFVDLQGSSFALTSEELL